MSTISVKESRHLIPSLNRMFQVLTKSEQLMARILKAGKRAPDIERVRIIYRDQNGFTCKKINPIQYCRRVGELPDVCAGDLDRWVGDFTYEILEDPEDIMEECRHVFESIRPQIEWDVTYRDVVQFNRSLDDKVWIAA